MLVVSSRPVGKKDLQARAGVARPETNDELTG